MMSPEEIIHSSSHESRRVFRKRIMIIGAIALVILVITASVVGSNAKKGGDSSPSYSSEDYQAMRTMIGNALTKEEIELGFLDLKGTYQNKALIWLLQNAQLANYDRSQILQRFTLACLYYATYQVSSDYTPNPSGWKDNTNWLSDENECHWMGIVCTEGALKVRAIKLESNGLTGRLPDELSLLRLTLEELDLTSNLIYMEDSHFHAFTKLTKLETVLMDDNYLSSNSGIPPEMAQLTNLEKLRLSYNLLSGPLDGALFKQWTKLTHLEIESNFLTGTIPHAVGQLPDLVYIYLRRNSLSFNLSWLRSGAMKSLFAMWLDSNEMFGSIPTEIGKLTGLASLSLSNATLTGTVPTEMGELTGLRRCWLYSNKLAGPLPTQLGKLSKLEVFEVQDNQLNGTMVPQVCSTLGASTYEHKSLTADCKEVSCDCCTTCGDE